MNFGWDPAKARRNRQKHEVSFEEATTVFGDPQSLTFPDPDHSAIEERFITIGLSNGSRVLMIAHTDDGDRIRIISARKATQRERRRYEEEN